MKNVVHELREKQTYQLASLPSYEWFIILSDNLKLSATLTTVSCDLEDWEVAFTSCWLICLGGSHDDMRTWKPEQSRVTMQRIYERLLGSLLALFSWTDATKSHCDSLVHCGEIEKIENQTSNSEIYEYL